MGILGGALLSVGRSVGLVFISPEVQDQQRAEKVQDQQPTGTESPGPRPGGSAEHQAPAAEVRRSVGRPDGRRTGRYRRIYRPGYISNGL